MQVFQELSEKFKGKKFKGKFQKWTRLSLLTDSNLLSLLGGEEK